MPSALGLGNRFAGPRPVLGSRQKAEQFRAKQGQLQALGWVFFFKVRAPRPPIFGNVPPFPHAAAL